MRLHIDIFAQQGLVKMIKIRLPRTDCSIWTSISEEAYSSSTSPERGITLLIQFAPLSLDSQSQKKRKMGQSRFRSTRIFRTRVYQKRSCLTDSPRLAQTPKRMGQSRLRQLLLRHDSWSQTFSCPQNQSSLTPPKLRSLEKWCLEQILHERARGLLVYQRWDQESERQQDFPLQPYHSSGQKRVLKLRQRLQRESPWSLFTSWHEVRLQVLLRPIGSLMLFKY